MNTDRKLRFGLVGAGAIAQTYVQAFRRSQLAEVAAVADVRLEAAQAVGEALPARALPSTKKWPLGRRWMPASFARRRRRIGRSAPTC